MAAASRTQDCAMGFLDFSWLGVCTISFKDNYWSNSTLLATLDLCLAVTGWIPISFFFLQCFYQFAFSFMHYIQMLLFFCCFFIFLDCRYLEIATCGFGRGRWTRIARLPRPLLLCSFGNTGSNMSGLVHDGVMPFYLFLCFIMPGVCTFNMQNLYFLRSRMLLCGRHVW